MQDEPWSHELVNENREGFIQTMYFKYNDIYIYIGYTVRPPINFNDIYR